jgi:hypothetical protein
LTKVLKKNKVTVEQFRGIEVSNEFADNPGEFDESQATSFLYQSGYLSLRPGSSDDFFTLDYPNREVLEAMSDLLVMDILGLGKQTEVYKKLKVALDEVDAGSVVEQFNQFLARVSYDDYNDADSEDAKNVTVIDVNGKKYYFNEYFYRALLCALLEGIGARVLAEVHRSMGRADIVLKWKGRYWVIELKVAREGNKEETLLNEAAAQIIKKRYAEPYDDPVYLGLVINSELRKITLYKVFTLPSDHDALHKERRSKAAPGHLKNEMNLKKSRTKPGQTPTETASDKGGAKKSSSESVENKKKSKKSLPKDAAAGKKIA